MIPNIQSIQISKIKDFLGKSIQFIHGLLTRLFPPGLNLKRTDNQYVEVLGLTGLFLFLLNINIVWDIHRNGETMLIIAFFLAWRHWKILLREPLFWLMLTFIASVIISTMIGIASFPDVRHQAEAKKMVRLALFVPLAWWIGTNIFSIRNAFLIVCLGFVLSMLPWLFSWDTLEPLLAGARANSSVLGMKTLYYANWAGFLLIGVTILGRDLFLGDYCLGKKAIFCYGFFFLVLICLTLGVILPQGRAVWIAVILTMPPGLIMRYFILEQNRGFSLKRMLLPVIILCLLGVVAGSQFSNIKERLLREREAIDSLIKGQTGGAHATSVGHRAQMYIWAFKTESFVTFFGWGPRAVQAISRDDELREHYSWNVRYEHMHSEYLELMIRTGVFGFCVVALILFFLIKQLHTGYKNKSIPSGYYAFFIATIAYLLLLGFSNVHLRINVFLPVIFGLMFAAILRSHHEGTDSVVLKC